MENPIIVGPLSAMIGLRYDDKGKPTYLGRPGDDDLTTANALVLLRRSTILASDRRGGPARLDDALIHRWAERTALGLGGSPDAGTTSGAGTTTAPASGLPGQVLARRTAAIRDLAASTPVRSDPPGCIAAFAVFLRPDGPALIGARDGGIKDVSLALHGTYGWPVIPGSTLKGAAHAYARDERGLDEMIRNVIFGAPRPRGEDEAARGSVQFLDALPAGTGTTVWPDVLTPHLREYYIDGKPPAEYWQPVPVPFLHIRRGTWLAFCVGPEEDARLAATLLGEAAGLLGLGAKTAAGYGYLTHSVSQIDGPAGPASG